MADLYRKKIIGLFLKVGNGSIGLADAGINSIIDKLRSLDEAGAEEMQKRYIALVRASN